MAFDFNAIYPRLLGTFCIRAFLCSDVSPNLGVDNNKGCHLDDIRISQRVSLGQLSFVAFFWVLATKMKALSYYKNLIWLLRCNAILVFGFLSFFPNPFYFPEALCPQCLKLSKKVSIVFFFRFKWILNIEFLAQKFKYFSFENNRSTMLQNERFWMIFIHYDQVSHCSIDTHLENEKKSKR